MQRSFKENLASVLAHSILFETKQTWSNCGHLQCKDPAPQGTGAAGQDIIAALTRQLPQLTQAITGQIMPNELAQLEASQAVSPEYAKMLNDLYAQYGPQLAQTGANVDRLQRTSAAQTDADIMRQLAPQFAAADQALSPEVSNVRRQAADSIGQLLGSFDLNNPDIEGERLVNQEAARSGNLGTPSATSTVSNALQFGDRGLQRRQALGNAISVASQFLPSAQSQFGQSALMNSIGRGASGTGLSEFAGVTPTGAAAQQQGMGMFEGLTGYKNNEAQLQGQRRDAFDRFMPDSISL